MIHHNYYLYRQCHQINIKAITLLTSQDTQSGPPQISKMEKAFNTKAVNYICKVPHLRYLLGSWLTLFI